MRKLLFGLILLVQTFAVAQTVSFTANLSSYTGAPAKAYLQLTLRVPSGCIPAGASSIPAGPQKYFPDASTGGLSFAIVPNTSLTCGGIADKTDYLVEVFQVAATPGQPDKKLYSAEYKIGPGAFSLATAVPVVPLPSNPLYDYAIRNAGNTFTGTQDFTGATVVGLSTTKPRRFLPAGTMDGVNKNFAFGSFPTDHAEFALYWNGQQLTETDDYTVSGTTVTMTKAPKSGDHLVAYF